MRDATSYATLMINNGCGEFFILFFFMGNSFWFIALFRAKGWLVA